MCAVSSLSLLNGLQPTHFFRPLALTFWTVRLYNDVCAFHIAVCMMEISLQFIIHSLTGLYLFYRRTNKTCGIPIPLD